jgi:hypothetical protein
LSGFLLRREEYSQMIACMSTKFNYIDDGICKVNESFSDTHGVLKKYGCTSGDILNLCGGVPTNTLLTIELIIKSVSLDTINAAIKNPVYYLERTIDFNLGLIAKNIMYIFGKGKHIGLPLFLNQVKQARSMNFSELTIFAAGYPAQKVWDGYYFWARMGHQMTDRNDIEDAKELLNRYQPGISLSELVLTDQGYKFWQQNGFEWNGHFLLNDKSENIQHLLKYLKMKGIDFIF